MLYIVVCHLQISLKMCVQAIALCASARMTSTTLVDSWRAWTKNVQSSMVACLLVSVAWLMVVMPVSAWNDGMCLFLWMEWWHVPVPLPEIMACACPSAWNDGMCLSLCLKWWHVPVSLPEMMCHTVPTILTHRHHLVRPWKYTSYKLLTFCPCPSTWIDLQPHPTPFNPHLLSPIPHSDPHTSLRQALKTRSNGAYDCLSLLFGHIPSLLILYVLVGVCERTCFCQWMVQQKYAVIFFRNICMVTRLVKRLIQLPKNEASLIMKIAFWFTGVLEKQNHILSAWKVLGVVTKGLHKPC